MELDLVVMQEPTEEGCTHNPIPLSWKEESETTSLEFDIGGW
jgi:hypothetical protein